MGDAYCLDDLKYLSGLELFTKYLFKEVLKNGEKERFLELKRSVVADEDLEGFQKNILQTQFALTTLFEEKNLQKKDTLDKLLPLIPSDWKDSVELIKNSYSRLTS